MTTENWKIVMQFQGKTRVFRISNGKVVYVYIPGYSWPSQVPYEVKKEIDIHLNAIKVD